MPFTFQIYQNDLNTIARSCSSGLFLRFHPVSTIYSEEEGGEDDEDADDGDGGERVVELDAGDDHRHHLPHRHDDHEDHRAEGADRVVDEELPGGRADGEDDAVEEEGRVLGHEDQGGVEDALLHQGDAGEEAGEQVDPGHHLDARHLVLGEEGSLPAGGERVKGHVAHEDYDAAERGHRTGLLALVRAKEEGDHADGDENSDDVLIVFVLSFAHDLPHQHYWDYLTCFRQNLRNRR